jgi:hypothetical protein
MTTATATPYDPADIITGVEARRITGLTRSQLNRLADARLIASWKPPLTDRRFFRSELIQMACAAYSPTI